MPNIIRVLYLISNTLIKYVPVYIYKFTEQYLDPWSYNDIYTILHGTAS